MALIARDGYRIHWQQDGTADGPPILFLNSLGTDQRLWDDVVARLPGYRLIRMDTRGHGQSDAPPGPYDLAGLSADAMAVVDHLGLSRLGVVGVSLGGQMAQLLAATHPERIACVLLSNTAPKMGTAESWQARIDAVTAGGVASIADAILDRWFAPATRHGPRIEFWKSMLASTPSQGYTGCCAALAASDLSAISPQIRCPTLVVAGTLDGASPPEVVRGLADAVPGAQYHEIPDVGHLPMAETPDLFAALVDKAMAPIRKEHADG